MFSFEFYLLNRSLRKINILFEKTKCSESFSPIYLNIQIHILNYVFDEFSLSLKRLRLCKILLR
jgi:hypothetical protein